MEPPASIPELQSEKHRKRGKGGSGEEARLRGIVRDEKEGERDEKEVEKDEKEGEKDEKEGEREEGRKRGKDVLDVSKMSKHSFCATE